MRALSIRRGLVLLLGCLLMLCLCSAAQAATVSITAVCPGAAADEPIIVRRVENRYSLYLPGVWDPSAVVLHFEGYDSLKAGNLTLVSGQATDFTAVLGKKQNLTDPKGRKLGTLTVYHGSALPSLFLTVDADELAAVNKSKNNEITEGKVVFVEADGTVAYNRGLTSFHGRGNSTFAYRKKPYQLKLEKKTDLCGMSAGKTWLLLNNWIDLSLLRNQITLNLCREIGIPFAIECQPVDVYINGSYNGLYLLTEKVQINKSRIDITNLEEANEALNGEDMQQYGTFDEETKELLSIRGYNLPSDPEDITGGYILEMEKSYRYRENIDNGFKTSGSICVTVKEPTCASRAQILYIGNLFNDFHNAIRAKDGVNPDTGMHYSEYIDVQSFARKYLIEEFTKNYDAQGSSQFFYKDADAVDPLIYAGPCWDYDLCCGNIRTGNFQKGSLPTGDYLTASASKANLYWLLSRQPDFMEQVVSEYRQTLLPALQIILGEREPCEGCQVRPFEDYVAAIQDSAAMNFARWPAGNVTGYYTGSGKNFDASCKYLLSWMKKRVAYMSKNWPVE